MRPNGRRRRAARFEVTAVEDQEPVETLGTYGADEAPCDRVRLAAGSAWEIGEAWNVRGFKMPVHAAARWYSWISPPSRSRRSISPAMCGLAVSTGSGESSASARCG